MPGLLRNFILLVLLLNIYVYPRVIKNDSTYANINSIPEGAHFYLNNIFMGTTPLSLINIPAGSYQVRFEKAGYNEWKHNIFFYEISAYNLTAVLDSTYGLVDFHSEPEGANVYIDDLLLGTTPIKNVKLLCGKYKIKLQKENYDDFHIVYPIIARDYTIFQKLKPISSNVSIIKSSPSISVMLDGKVISTDSATEALLSKGKHNIEFSGRPLKRTFATELDIDTDFEYTIELKSKSFKPVYYSAVLPGLGQLHNGSYIKGISFLTGTLLSGAIIITAINNYNDKAELANYTSKAYTNSFTEPQARFNYDRVLKTRAEANKSLNFLRSSLGAFIGIYIINLIDSIFFESNDFIDIHSFKTNFTPVGSAQTHNYSLDFNVPLR